MFIIKEDETGVVIRIKVQPRASKNEAAGIMGDALKIRLTSPPVDGSANEGLIKFFAGLCRVPMKSVKLLSGMTSRNKTVEIQGVTSKALKQLLHLDEEEGNIRS